MKKNGNAEGYFVISIDDTDLNIERAFEIVEDIRKYLTFWPQSALSFVPASHFHIPLVYFWMSHLNSPYI